MNEKELENIQDEIKNNLNENNLYNKTDNSQSDENYPENIEESQINSSNY